MKYFSPPTRLVLKSDLDPEECAQLLREAIDAERPTVFGFSGYLGSKPFLGEVDGTQFRVLQRTFSMRNTLPTVLTGEFQPQGRGTRVNGAFDLELTSKIALCLFSAFGLLVLVPVVIYSYTSQPLLSVAFACGYAALVFFSPRIVRAYGSDQEKRIGDFLRIILQADDDLSSSSSDAGS